MRNKLVWEQLVWQAASEEILQGVSGWSKNTKQQKKQLSEKIKEIEKKLESERRKYSLPDDKYQESLDKVFCLTRWAFHLDAC
ncbi:MAG: hypothetical protein ACPLTR_12140, partial [Thermacetogeniaceae bacterium]